MLWNIFCACAFVMSVAQGPTQTAQQDDKSTETSKSEKKTKKMKKSKKGETAGSEGGTRKEPPTTKN